MSLKQLFPSVPNGYYLKVSACHCPNVHVIWRYVIVLGHVLYLLAESLSERVEKPRETQSSSLSFTESYYSSVTWSDLSDVNSRL